RLRSPSCLSMSWSQRTEGGGAQLLRMHCCSSEGSDFHFAETCPLSRFRRPRCKHRPKHLVHPRARHRAQARPGEPLATPGAGAENSPDASAFPAGGKTPLVLADLLRTCRYRGEPERNEDGSRGFLADVSPNDLAVSPRP